MNKVLSFVNDIHDLDLKDILDFGRAAQKEGAKVELLEIPEASTYGFVVAVFTGTPEEAVKEIASYLK